MDRAGGWVSGSGGEGGGRGAANNCMSWASPARPAHLAPVRLLRRRLAPGLEGGRLRAPQQAAQHDLGCRLLVGARVPGAQAACAGGCGSKQAQARSELLCAGWTRTVEDGEGRCKGTDQPSSLLYVLPSLLSRPPPRPLVLRTSAAQPTHNRPPSKANQEHNHSLPRRRASPPPRRPPPASSFLSRRCLSRATALICRACSCQAAQAVYSACCAMRFTALACRSRATCWRSRPASEATLQACRCSGR